MKPIGRLVLWIWAVWLSVVTLTNIADALKALGVLPPQFTFSSGNYAFMRSVTVVHHTPVFLVAVLFAGVIAWEIVATVLHWRAVAAFTTTTIQQAFLASIALWGAFMVADEIFLSYEVEATHTRLFVAALVSVIVLHYGTLEPAAVSEG